MSEPGDFLRELLETNMARITGVVANRTRGMSTHDAQEIFSATLLAAWERRSQFSLEPGEGAVEGKMAAWLDSIARDQRRRFTKQQLPTGAVSELERLMAPDDTESPATLEQFLAQLPVTKQDAAKALIQGESLRNVSATTGLNRGQVKELKKKLRWVLATDHPPQVSPRREHRQSDETDYLPSQIDRDIANMNAPIRHGRECTPCVKCLWFEKRWAALKGPHWHIEDGELAAAIIDTHARKISISSNVETYI